MYPKLTIFTPTYNRANTLKRLYSSLCIQTVKDFIWLVVDDGSTDNTEELFELWSENRYFAVRYVKQQNGGKMRAHNCGVKQANTELFVCVDSDDYLEQNAVEKILNCWQDNKKDFYAGIIAYKSADGLNPVGNEFIKLNRVTLSGEYKAGFKGDTTLIYRTDVLKDHLFPEIENEKFVTEAYIYDQIDQKFQMLLLPEICTIIEYLPDGYSNSYLKLLRENPIGWSLYYKQCYKLERSFSLKIKYISKYICFSLLGKSSHILKKSGNRLFCVFCYPLGVLLYYKMLHRFSRDLRGN